MAEKRKKKNTICKYLIVLVALIKAIRFQSFQFKMKIELGMRKRNIEPTINASGYVDTITAGIDRSNQFNSRSHRRKQTSFSVDLRK